VRIEGREIVQPVIFRTNCRDDGLEAAEYDDRLMFVTKCRDALRCTCFGRW